MDRRRQRAPDASGAAARDSRPPRGCSRRRTCPCPVRSRPSNLEDIPPRRLRPRLGRAPPWLPIGRLRVPRPVVSWSVLLSVLLLERSPSIDTAGGESRSQRSAAGSLEVPSRGCAVSCLTDTDRTSRSPAPDEYAPASCLVGCFLGGLLLFFRATPRTPLRVLCVIALDTVHVLRTGRPLSRSRMPAVGSVPGLSSLHECDLGWQGSMRARIPCAATATGEHRSRGVDDGIPQPGW